MTTKTLSTFLHRGANTELCLIQSSYNEQFQSLFTFFTLLRCSQSTPALKAIFPILSCTRVLKCVLIASLTSIALSVSRLSRWSCGRRCSLHDFRSTVQAIVPSWTTHSRSQSQLNASYVLDPVLIYLDSWQLLHPNSGWLSGMHFIRPRTLLYSLRCHVLRSV